MSDTKPTKVQLPTGEEPPRGYETLIKEEVKEDEETVKFVMHKHLARSEQAQIEALREKALESVKNYIGLSNEPLSLDREIQIIKEVDDSNKMFALVYNNNKLVGYSLIITGWPEPCKWLIQHMIIDPDMRGRGIGSTIVDSIEHHAGESQVEADAIFAIPIQESGKSFWQEKGYVVEAGRFLVKVADVDHELIVYHKEL